MCFLSFFELHQLQLSCTAPRSTVCHSRVSSTSSSSCALSSLYKAPDARVAASSLVPAGDAALKKKIPVTALISRTKSYIVYIAIPERVVRSINACAVVCTDTLSTLRPGSARHSGQRRVWRPRARRDSRASRGVEAGRRAASHMRGRIRRRLRRRRPQPSSDYSICPNGPDCHDLAMTAARANRYVS